MTTGLFQPFRIYTMATGQPELSNNDFYCKDYDHDEYIVLPPESNKLLPFAIVFKGVNPSIIPNFAATTFKLVCSETEVAKAVTFNVNDFTSEIDGGDRFIFYSAATAFTSGSSIAPGRYHLLIEKLNFGIDYSFYSETFILKRYI